jgi:GAF domain-containing protein
MPVAEGICGRVAREGRAIYVPDATLEPGFVPCEFPTRSSFVAPIMAPDNRVIGIMEVDALVPNAWDPATRAAIELAARDLLRHPGI